jgi:transposase
MMKPLCDGKRREIMAVAVSAMHPVAHLPLILGMLRKLEVAALIDDLIPPHPDHVLSGGRGVEALVLAILDGHPALYKVGTRLAERGMVSLLQPSVARESRNEYRLGQMLDALCAANLNRVFSVLARKALAVSAIPTPWMHQDTTTIALYGASTGDEEPSEQGAQELEGPVAPRPAYGQSKEGRNDLKQVVLSLGVSGAGGLPLRLGSRDGKTSESTDNPVAIEACLALGLQDVMGIVADRTA